MFKKTRVVEGANPYGYAVTENKSVGDGTLTSRETEPSQSAKPPALPKGEPNMPLTLGEVSATG